MKLHQHLEEKAVHDRWFSSHTVELGFSELRQICHISILIGVEGMTKKKKTNFIEKRSTF